MGSLGGLLANFPGPAEANPSLFGERPLYFPYFPRPGSLQNIVLKKKPL
jgi:hypothetical protein